MRTILFNLRINKIYFFLLCLTNTKNSNVSISAQLTEITYFYDKFDFNKRF